MNILCYLNCRYFNFEIVKCEGSLVQSSLQVDQRAGVFVCNNVIRTNEPATFNARFFFSSIRAFERIRD